MNTTDLCLDHKSVLYEPLHELSIPVSEFSFANLYLFRDVHEYELIQEENMFVRGISRDGVSFLLPVCDPRELSDEYVLDLCEKADVDAIYPVPEEWLEGMNEQCFEWSYQDGDTDYIFRKDKIADLEGRELHKKRNLLNQFERKYDHRAVPLTQDLLGDAREVLDKWQEEMDVKTGETDYYPCREAIELYDELILCGVMYYAEGEPAGFIIGDELNDSTFALHFAKAKRRFKGVYEYIFNTFAGILPEKYDYMNFEQDLGIPGIRRAKSSYDPDILLKKYRLMPR